MGIWAKGEFTAVGKVPGVDYYCAPTPSNNGYLYNVDSLYSTKLVIQTNKKVKNY